MNEHKEFLSNIRYVARPHAKSTERTAHVHILGFEQLPKVMRTAYGCALVVQIVTRILIKIP